MKDRCYNPKSNVYKYYGGKGVSVCDEWLFSFDSFKEWALQNGYDDTLSIDRKNGALEYNPLNCRWATRMEQQSNLGWNKRYNYNGEMLTAPEIARIANIPLSVMYGRLGSGKSVYDSVNRPYVPMKEKPHLLKSK